MANRNSNEPSAADAVLDEIEATRKVLLILKRLPSEAARNRVVRALAGAAGFEVQQRGES